MIYRRKIKSFLRKCSPILVPVLVLCFLLFISNFSFLSISPLCKDKANLIVNLDGTFIGVLITIFTIYVSFPLAAGVRERFAKSKHQRIFISHIWTGIILFILSMFTYLVIEQYDLVAALFLMGMSNLVVTAYYITKLVTYIEV